jgi:type I restriction enzyme S subunit
MSTTPLRELTKGGVRGIFNGPRFARQYVEDPRFGVPLLSGADILAADLSHVSLISRKQAAAMPEMLLERGTSLVTSYGTVGRTAYVRADMEGMVGSDNVMKVVPAPSLTVPGYLFAFLSSKYGVPITTVGTTGGTVPFLPPERLFDLPVPRLGEDVERHAHTLVVEAAELRTEAWSALVDVTAHVEQEIGAPLLRKLRDDPRTVGNTVNINTIQESRRLEAFFHNPVATDLDRWIAGHPKGHWRLGEIADVFDVPLFKHIYVGKDRGVPFYTSGDLFRLERLPEKYLSRTRTKGLPKYILETGWVLLARSGQLGGIIGRPQFADSALHNAATSDHVIRIVPHRKRVPPGYLYAYLATPTVGYTLLTRTMTGASVPALWPTYLNEVCVVQASVGFMANIDDRVRQAFEKRLTATRREREARALVERAIEEAT